MASKLIEASVSVIDSDNFLRIENVGSGLPQSITDFTNYWWDFWGATGNLKIGAIPYRDNEVMRFVPFVKKA